MAGEVVTSPGAGLPGAFPWFAFNSMCRKRFPAYASGLPAGIAVLRPMSRGARPIVIKRSRTRRTLFLRGRPGIPREFPS